jgi:ATP-dependent exoDNAse (exonuclease V) alpha subunit
VSAYACTIHQSQGSEYPAMLISLLTQHYAMPQLRRCTNLAEWLSAP